MSSRRLFHIKTMEAGLSLLFFMASTPAPAQEAKPDAAASVASSKVRRGPFRVAFETEGVFVPAQATELSFMPRAYEGELRVALVAPHGAAVRQGDIILRLDDERARDLLTAAEWTVRSAERTLADAKARREDFENDTKNDLTKAEKDLALAEKSLKGYIEVSRPLEKDEFEQSERFQKNNIADQEDEIAQLGKMYKEDQLTEETEEIVLKRAKRTLEESKKRLALMLRRNAYSEEFTEPQQRESLENLAKDKRKALRDLRRGRETANILGKVELEKLEHDFASARQRLERLREDVEHMTFRAPHDGILLHGSFEDRVVVTPIRRLGPVLANTPLLTVARPGTLKVRFSLKEKDRYRLEAGMAAAITPEALQDRRLAGSLEPIEGFPLPDNSWNAHVIFGHADDRLLPLMKAKVVVTLFDGIDALTLPMSAVFRKGDRSLCYVRGKSPFGVIARTVVTGPDDGKSIVIREGLSEGDEVLLQEPAQ